MLKKLLILLTPMAGLRSESNLASRAGKKDYLSIMTLPSKPVPGNEARYEPVL